jgi:hypothetical protein
MVRARGCSGLTTSGRSSDRLRGRSLQYICPMCCREFHSTCVKERTGRDGMVKAAGRSARCRWLMGLCGCSSGLRLQ